NPIKANGPLNDSATAAAEPAACANCGVVEAVTAVQHKGEGSGVGAVAGGVAGGVLGNQFGSGNGRTALRVLGAIGGAVAGNEVEKRARSVTVYRVKVRTDNGEIRTVEQSTAPAVGQRVRIDGQHLKLLAA
ncbi:MAG: glycine zipper 2TM domain-containing protein, partial [Leptothrix sp. (in: b-proteobacteria)]